MRPKKKQNRRIVVIGAGPAGLMAAETLAQNDLQVEVYDSMPSAGRKFLIAGKSGLNLTHSEPYKKFLSHYGKDREKLKPYLDAFTPQDLRDWAKILGIKTFVGSSGKVFPTTMTAASMLKVWRDRLSAQGITFHFRQRWEGWDETNAFQFDTTQGKRYANPDAVILALGGGSWQQTGSTGAWTARLAARGVEVAPLKPANCGFDVAWSTHLKQKFAGAPVKTVNLSFGGKTQRGEFVITQYGVEGHLIYQFSAALRDAIEEKGNAVITLDLLPDWSIEKIDRTFAKPRRSRSISSYLKKEVGIEGIKASLLWETLPHEKRSDLDALKKQLKSLSLTLNSPRPLEEAISSAGGVSFNALDENLMLKKIPGVFCAGEMLDWEAPTGGYLLTACFATGRAAGKGVAARLEQKSS